MTEETKKTITRDEMFARLELAKALWGAPLPAGLSIADHKAAADDAWGWVMDGRALEGSGGCGCKDKKPKSQERADLLASPIQYLVKNAIKIQSTLTVREYINKGNPMLAMGEKAFISGVLYTHGLREGMTEEALHKWIMNDK